MRSSMSSINEETNIELQGQSLGAHITATVMEKIPIEESWSAKKEKVGIHTLMTGLTSRF
jgi:hypothetical protein